MSVTTVGIDCATDPRRVGLALGSFSAGRTRVEEVHLGTRDAQPADVVAAWIRRAPGPVLVALDAPLGWPAPLARVLPAHRAGAALDEQAHDLFRRQTDRFVRGHLGKQSLDVGADRIARTAHAALAMLGRLRQRLNLPIPLAWEPDLDGVAAIEVYPAATLKAHHVSAQGYKSNKDSGTLARGRIVAALGERLELPLDRDLLLRCDDTIDAAVCLLAAEDFLSGLALAPPDRALAEHEGWIWVRPLCKGSQ